MNKLIKKMSKKVAQPPGTLIHVGEKKTESVSITLTRYDKETLEEKKMEDLCECLSEKEFKGDGPTPLVFWQDVSAVPSVQ